MRSIKFRAYLHDYKTIAEVEFVSLIFNEIIARVEGGLYELELGEYELMQYTGLKDKNGKEIYEKDILEFDNRRHVVTFDNGGFGIWKDVRVDLYSNQMRKLREPLWNLVVDECEIVGNVYQDKHLLEGEE